MKCGVTEDSVGALVAKAQEYRAVQELSLGPDRLWLPQNPRWQYGDQVTTAHQAGSLKCIGR